MPPTPLPSAARRFLATLWRRVKSRPSPGCPDAERLAHAEALLQGVLDHSLDGIVALQARRDAEGQVADFVVTLVNPAGERILRRAKDALLGHGLREVFPGAEDAHHFERYVRVLETGEPLRAEFYHPQAGHDAWYEVTAVRLDDGLAITFQDVTDLKDQQAALQRSASELRRANEQLLQVDRYKDEFFAIVSHELRTPLNFITGFASVLDDEVLGALSARQHESVVKILGGAERMLRLVDELLDYTRVQADRFSVDTRPTDYAELVDGVVARARAQAAAKGLSVSASAQVSAQPAIDAPRIAQVLANLVGNAIKFTPPGGHVSVTATARDGWLLTEVADTGIGIPEEQQESIFLRFQQADMSRTRPVGGFGLGLAIAKAIVLAHGGQVGVRSRPGEGSTFWFTLPLAAAASPTAPEAEPRQAG